MRLRGGARLCNVYWQVESSATFGTASSFAGVVLAHESITMDTAAQIEGQLFALGITAPGAITFDSNVVEPPDCSTATCSVATRTRTVTATETQYR